MKVPFALVLSIALLAREFPASAAASDLSEARRRFVAAVQSSDRDIAAAEAALDDLIRKASPLLTGSDQKKLDEMRKALKALGDFKAEKARILARDLGKREQLEKAAEDYGRACQVLAAVIVVVIAVVVAAFTFGASAALVVTAVVAAAAVCTALVGLTATLAASLPVIATALDAAAIASFAAARVALAQANAAARDALARLPAAPKPVLERKTLERAALGGAAFEGELGGSFHVELENGQVTRPAGQANLQGTIVITSRSNANVKLTLEGDATLTAGGSGGAWASLLGHGTARLSGFGGSLTILNATVESQGASVLTLRGGDVSARGCTHSVQAGSRVSGNELSLAGSLRCGSWTLASSTLKLEAGGVSGGGTFTAWSRNFSMSYSASGGALRARGSISGSDTPWTHVPGLPAEYKIDSPKLSLRLEGPALEATFEAGGVRARTTATKPGGSPWSSKTLNIPGTIEVSVPPSTTVPVPLPNLPSPDDVFKAAREECERLARLIPPGDGRNTALAVCRVDHPSPPAVPSLPDRISVPVRDIF